VRYRLDWMPRFDPLVPVRVLVRPFGYLAFVLALASLSAASRLLGDKDELGFFTGRLADMLWRYPEVTRKGVQIAWVAWALAFVICISPYDPLTTTPWDEAALAAIAMAVLWRRTRGGRRVEH
jgi:hypothetical protein